MPNAIDYSIWKEERIDGKIYYMSPSASPKHTGIIMNIFKNLDSNLKNNLCKVYIDGIDVFLEADNDTYVKPDVSILCNKSNLKKNGYYGVPLFIAEVLSPSSLKHDRFIKFNLYEKVGVKEYWIVDPYSNTIEQYVLDESSYELINVYKEFDESELTQLTDQQRDEYTTKVKVHVLPDVEIELSAIFETW